MTMASAASDSTEEAGKTLASTFQSQESLEPIIAHGGGQVQFCTPEAHLAKSRSFTNVFYKDWETRLSAPIIPAVCYLAAGNYETRCPEASGYMKLAEEEKPKLQGQLFEEKWFELFKDAARCFKNALPVKDAYWPYLVLYNADYSKYSENMIPNELKASICELTGRKSNKEPNFTYGQSYVTAKFNEDGTRCLFYMVDFIVFVKASDEPNAISRENAVLLVECKSAQRKRMQHQAQAYDQLKRCEEFLKVLWSYVCRVPRPKVDQTGDSITGEVDRGVADEIASDSTSSRMTTAECIPHEDNTSGIAAATLAKELNSVTLRQDETATGGCASDASTFDANTSDKSMHVTLYGTTDKGASIACNVYHVVCIDTDVEDHVVTIPAANAEDNEHSVHILGNKYLANTPKFVEWMKDLLKSNNARSDSQISNDIFSDLLSLMVAQQNVISAIMSAEMTSVIHKQLFYEKTHKRQQKFHARSSGKIVKADTISSQHKATQIYYLSPDQAQMLSDPTDFCMIFGPPGSGKTIILQHKALRYFADGFIVVCAVGGTGGLLKHYENVFESNGFSVKRKLCQDVTIMKKAAADTCYLIIAHFNVEEASELVTKLVRNRKSRLAVIMDDCFATFRGIDIIRKLFGLQPDAFWCVPAENNYCPDFIDPTYLRNDLFDKVLRLNDSYRYQYKLFETLKKSNHAFASASCAHSVSGEDAGHTELLVPIDWKEKSRKIPLASAVGAVKLKAISTVGLQGVPLTEHSNDVVKEAIEQYAGVRNHLEQLIDHMLEDVCLVPCGELQNNILQQCYEHDYTRLAILVNMSSDSLDELMLSILQQICENKQLPTKKLGEDGNKIAIDISNNAFGSEFIGVLVVHHDHSLASTKDKDVTFSFGLNQKKRVNTRSINLTRAVDRLIVCNVLLVCRASDQQRPCSRW